MYVHRQGPLRHCKPAKTLTTSCTLPSLQPMQQASPLPRTPRATCLYPPHAHATHTDRIATIATSALPPRSKRRPGTVGCTAPARLLLLRRRCHPRSSAIACLPGGLPHPFRSPTAPALCSQLPPVQPAPVLSTLACFRPSPTPRHCHTLACFSPSSLHSPQSSLNPTPLRCPCSHLLTLLHPMPQRSASHCPASLAPRRPFPRFRVYERTVSGLLPQDEDIRAPPRRGLSPLKVCRFLEAAVLGFAMIGFIVLALLHVEFQGSGGCLPHALNVSSARPGSMMAASMPATTPEAVGVGGGGESLGSHGALELRKDVILSLYVTTTDRPRAIVNGTDPLATEYVASYEFSKTASLIYMDETLRQSHNFTSIPIMLPSTCFGTGVTHFLVSNIVRFHLGLSRVVWDCESCWDLLHGVVSC